MVTALPDFGFEGIRAFRANISPETGYFDKMQVSADSLDSIFFPVSSILLSFGHFC